MAFELSKLSEKLKSKGMPLAEEAAKLVEESVLEWLKEGALESENKLDDICIPILEALKPLIDSKIDKIS